MIATKKLIIIPLALMLICSPFTVSAAETTTDTEVTVVEYDHIGDFIAENNSAVRSVMQSYRMLDVRMSVLQREIKEFWGGFEPGAVIPVYILESLEDAVKALKDEIRYMDRDLNRAAGGQVHAARLLFLKHYILSEQLDISQRALENVKQDLELSRKLREIGFIPQSAVDELERSVRSGNESIKAVSKTIDDNLKALSDILWIHEPISLNDLPEMELESIMKRDLDADLAAYTLSAPDVQEKKVALDNARNTLNRQSSSVNRRSHQDALDDYERAMELAALDFPGVYRELLDTYNDHINSTIVKDAETDLAKMKNQFAAGHVSRNSVTAAERVLLDAKSIYEQERISVYIALLEYEYGLINWVK